MARHQHDPRVDAKHLADRTSSIAMVSFQNELYGISRCLSAAAARSRVRALRTKARREGLGHLVAALEGLLKGPRARDEKSDGWYETCVICGSDAVRYLRKPSFPEVCEEHSTARDRDRDLRSIRACLLDPPPEFFEALGRCESAIQLSLEEVGEDASNLHAPIAIGVLWRRLLARHPITSTSDVWRLWQWCCDPYPNSSLDREFESPDPPITQSLWSVVSDWARARDAEASVRNGQQYGGRPRDQHQENEITRLAKRGMKQVEIAAQVGTTQCQVSRVLRRLRTP